MKPRGSVFVILVIIIVLGSSIAFFASTTHLPTKHKPDFVYTYEPEPGDKKPNLDELQCEVGFYFDGYSCIKIPN